MTTEAPGSNSRAPDGFLKDLRFDAQGNIIADGKPLNGVRFDASSLTTNQKSKPTNYFEVLKAQQYKAPDYSKGGAISRLGTDDKGNVYAFVDTAARDQFGRTQERTGLSSISQKDTSMKGFKLEGLRLDPNRTNRNPGALREDDELFLREEKDGLYFAEIKRGANTIGYAYSDYQVPSAPLGGSFDDQDLRTRKQGGNAQRGIGGTSNKLILGAG